MVDSRNQERGEVTSGVIPIALDGRFVRLRPITRADYSFLWQCRTHPEVMHLWTQGRTIPGFEQYAQELEAGLGSHFLTLLMIETADEQHPIGFVFAHDYSANDRYAFFNIVLAPPFSHFQWGAEALYLFLDYLFGFFDLRKVCADVFEFNQHQVALLLRNGATQEGRFRGQRYYQGRYHDVIRVGMLQEEWMAGREELAKLLTPPEPAETAQVADAGAAVETLAALADDAASGALAEAVPESRRQAGGNGARAARATNHRAKTQNG
jgi:RimJ/RimL family protein N-acetyltransferase